MLLEVHAFERGFMIRGSHFLKREFMFLEKEVHKTGVHINPLKTLWLRAWTQSRGKI